MIAKDKIRLQENHLDALSRVAALQSRIEGSHSSPGERIEDLVGMLISKGQASLERKQFDDAREFFESALYLDPEHPEARTGLRRVYRKIVPRWHFEMLNDHERNSAFERALAKAVTNSSVVLDIGSGSGLLAMMAARAGASETISCEMITSIAELARETVARNDYTGRVTILNKKSTELRVGVDLKKRANLLVTETVDCGLLGEGIISSIAHARENLLTQDARIIPRSASIIAMLVEGERLRNLNRADTAAGFDVSPINRYVTAGYFPVRLGAFDHVRLTEPFEVFHFDFTSEIITPTIEKILVPVKRDGTCHAVVFWFDMRLDEEIFLSNYPGSTTHWEQALQCMEKVVPVRVGETLTMVAEHDCSAVSFRLIEAA